MQHFTTYHWHIKQEIVIDIEDNTKWIFFLISEQDEYYGNQKH